MYLGFDEDLNKLKASGKKKTLCNMTSLIDQFPTLTNVPEFLEFVEAVRVKETENGITMSKMRTWLGQYTSPMKSIRDILCTDPYWSQDQN